MHNPNYTSVRCTQPLPAVIKLRSNHQQQHQDGNSLQNAVIDTKNERHDGDSENKVAGQPLLLTNHSYEEHCFNQSNNQSGNVSASPNQAVGISDDACGDSYKSKKSKGNFRKQKICIWNAKCFSTLEY